MVPLGTTKDVARIVDYQRFYKPKINEFILGFAYEYVQLSFSDILTHLPDLDDSGEKPRCTYDTNWTKAVWGAPWSVMELSNLEELMKKDKVRAKKNLPTKYFKELLKKQPLAFNWKGLHIVVFPKPAIQKDGVEIIGDHIIYVNGVEQNLIRTKEESKLYKRWFTPNADAIKLDWRYLLGLDTPEISGTNVLYTFFEGVFTKDESSFDNIGKNFMTGGPENPPAMKNTGMPRGSYAAHKQALKETKYANVVGSMKVYNHKSEDELSGEVLEAREVAKVKRIERTIQEEIKAATKAQKKAEHIIADDKNRQKMELQTMVCIQNKETKEVLRVTQYESVKYTKTDKWVYVEKYMWEPQLHEKDTKKSEVKPSGINRKMMRRRQPRFKPGFKFIQHKKKPVEYETEIHKDEEYYVEQTEADMWPKSEYEYTPVVHGKLHPDKQKRGQPYMIFGWDAEGNKILKQAVKRQLKQVFDVAKNAYVGCKLVKVERWKRVVKEPTKTLSNVKSTKQMEASKQASTRVDQGSKQENKRVEKDRGDDKRVKTPNIKH